jgi:hypothetical protein
MAGPDYREGVAALRENRPPHFSDLPPTRVTMAVGSRRIPAVTAGPGLSGPDQRSAVSSSSRWAKRSLASARRVGTCSLGTSTGLYPLRVWRATVTLCTSSGPS